MSLWTTPEVESCQCKPLLQYWPLISCCEVIQKLPLLPYCSHCLWRVTSSLEPQTLRRSPLLLIPIQITMENIHTLMLLNGLSFFRGRIKEHSKKNNLVMTKKCPQTDAVFALEFSSHPELVTSNEASWA